LEAPEGGSYIALIDLRAKDADEAVKKASRIDIAFGRIVMRPYKKFAFDDYFWFLS
jgi:hypothetical protein